MVSSEDKKNEIIIDQKANNLVLYFALAVNVVLFSIGIFQTASLISDVTLAPFTEVLVMQVTRGSGIVPAAGIITCLIILILNRLNVAIGKKVPLIASIIKIFLKIPINFILLLFAAFYGISAWGAYSVGSGDIAVGFGTIVIQVANLLSLLFLVFFVRKI